MSNTDLEKILQDIKNEVNEVLKKHKDNVQIIRSKEELSEYIDKAIENKVISIDTETNNSLDPLTCKLMGLCLYTPNEKQVYVPVNHRDPLSRRRLPQQLDVEVLKEELSRIKKAQTKVIMHNGKFDYEVIKCTCDIEIVPDWDTMIAAVILNENESKSLKWQYKNKIDPTQEEYKIEKLFKKVPYADVDIESFALYSATDAYITFKLFEYQLKEFKKKDNKKLFELFKDIEMPMIKIAADMELIGVRADLGYVQKLKNKYSKKIDEVNVKIQELYQEFKELVDEWRKSASAQRNELIDPTNSDYKKANFDKKFDITNDIKGIQNKLGKKKLEHIGEEITVTSPKQLSIFFYDILEAANLKNKKPRGTGKHQLEQLIENFKTVQDHLKLFIKVNKEEKENPINEEEVDEDTITVKKVLKNIKKYIKVKINPEIVTDEDIYKLIDRYKKATYFCELLLEQRQYNKLITTYLNSIPKLSKHWSDGKVRFHLNTYGAATGRFSSGGGWKFLNEHDEQITLQGMNQQNLPSKNHEIRLSFVADEGRVFVSGDFSSQEPKITAFVSQDEEMIKAFVEKKDIYAIIAQSAYGNRYEDNLEWYPAGTVLKDENGNEYICGEKTKINEKGKKNRKVGKTIFLAITYGMGASSLAEIIKQDNESRDEALYRANQMLVKVFEKFKGAYKAIQDSIIMCKKYGYVEGLYGRRRRLPDLMLPHYSAIIVNKHKLTGKENEFAKEYLRRISETGKDFLTLDELEKLNEEALKNNIQIISNEGLIRRAERQCFNSIIQGSAATMTKRTMIMIENDRFLRQLDAHLIFQIHDELLLDCPKENEEKVAKRLQYLMEHSVDDLGINIPMSCDMVREERWGEDVMSEEIRGEYLTLVDKNSENPIEEIHEEYCNFPPEAINNVLNGISTKILFPVTDEIIEEIIDEDNQDSSLESEKDKGNAEVSGKNKKNKKKAIKAPKTNKKPDRDISFNGIVKDLLRASNEPITIVLNEEKHSFSIEGDSLVITSIRGKSKSFYKINLHLNKDGSIITDEDDKKESNLIKVLLGLVKVPTFDEEEESYFKRKTTLSLKKAIKNKEIEVIEEGDEE